MSPGFFVKSAVCAAAVLALTACSELSGPSPLESSAAPPDPLLQRAPTRTGGDERTNTESIFDLFIDDDNPNVTIEVSKYIWFAAQDILDFMPLQSADPFSGVMVYGFGTPPGGRQAYRATVYVTDPALDARSLRLSLLTRSGPVPLETLRAVEDAILTRARQLRLADTRL